MDKLKRLIELKEAHQRMDLNEDDYIGIAQVIDEAIRGETLTFGAKPCPFCGGEATLKPEGDYHEVTCDNCGAHKTGHTYDDAINEWNWRTK